MSASRLFQLVALLLERGRMTAPQLARELEVSARTVRRDVEVLSAAGVPIYTAQGSGGGVDLLEGFVLDRSAFSPQEQGQLLCALRALPQCAGEDALAKLSALFRREAAGGDWLRVCLPRWGEGPRPEGGLFALLRRAILARHPLRFTYRSTRHGTRSRRALPARLVCQGQVWFLQALDLEDEEYRLFRLSRMQDVQGEEAVFHRRLDPPEPDLSGDIPPLFRVEARLRFSPALAGRVYDTFAPACIAPQPDGSLVVEAVLPQGQWLELWLLSFGPGLEVLAPEGLRARLAALAGEVARQYET